MSFRNSVAARVTLSYAGVIIVFAAAVGLSIGRLAAFDTAVSEITGPEFTNVETTDAWAAGLSESMSHTRNMLIMDDKAQIQGELDKVGGLTEKSKQYADTMIADVRSPEGKVLLQEALDARTNLVPFDQEFLRQVDVGDIKAAKETLLQRARPAQLALIAALGKLGDYQKAQIRDRVDSLEVSYHRARTLLISLSLAAVAIACLLAFLLTRVIKNPLNHAVAVLSEIEKGNYASNVIVSSNDEIGQTLQGLERMQAALREEHASAIENARIRTALDRVSVGAMLCDTDGKIIYMNDALRALFRNQAVEIRKAVPLFDPEQLLGRSFDIFHQIPSLQRHHLGALTSTHTADVKIGEASLRIVANPVDGNGQRAGTVVQWVDRTQEVATEEEVQATVPSRPARIAC